MKINIPDREVRTFAVGELRVMAEDGAKPKITGYAAKFNSMSQDLGGFFEVIQPGTFLRAIKNSDIRCLWDHLSHIVLGRNIAGTLMLREDDTGLYYECDVPETQMVKDMVLAPISRGDVSQCSFGFRTITDKWEVQDGKTVRTLMDVELFDVSPVTYPAYQDTAVAVRSMKAFQSPPVRDTWQAGLQHRRRLLDLSL